MLIIICKTKKNENMVDYILLQTKQVLSYNVEKYYYFNINNIILLIRFFLS